MILRTVRLLETWVLWMGLVSVSYGVVMTNPDSVFNGTGALFDVNGNSIVVKTDGSNQVARWNDALAESSGMYFIERTAGNYATLTTFNGHAAIQSRLTSNAATNTILSAKTASGADAQMTLRTLLVVTNVDSHSNPGYIFGSSVATTTGTLSDEYGLRVASNDTLGIPATVQNSAVGDFRNNGSCTVNGIDQGTGTRGITSLNQDVLIAMECAESNVRENRNYSLGGFRFLDTTYAGRGFAGSVAEIVAFDYFLSSEEMKIANTLLSAKYGMTMAEGSVYTLTSTNDVFYLGRTQEDTNEGFFNVTNSGSGGFGIEISNTSGVDVFTDTANNGIFFSQVETGGIPAYVAQTLTDELSFGDSDNTFATLEWNFDELGISSYEDRYALTFLGADGILETLASTVVSDGKLQFTINASLLRNGTFGLQAVPEPATWMLLVVGLGGMAMFRKRAKTI
ncbi:MAG: PEP-CTERM sorting domain-containing protein [Planctomycetia bacterium]|nr:PEP-CTERM sorting domain-containing protein [Planctomycetia bacterium]